MRVHQHRVRYHETDAQGFMFNARFLELADVAMAELFRALGWTYDELVASGTDPSVVSAALSFYSPARHDDIIDIAVTCTNVGRSSFALAFDLRRNDVGIATIEIVYVNVDASAAVSRPVPNAVAAALRASMTTNPTPGQHEQD
ncbi:acyl-CoA thioesterase [Nocardioides sp. KIGAM211]|uniref:Acyl-CoA thioesterase n=1 Tax=Nocardioides luti TaxID=2761101 RepID=A0A7X0VAQ4_9ACTN|nr:thioesterase family protein [Nocardioides luti]MBB6627585.1 acyl-CoA thioesterase [Nocardioides luti]